ncbi:hypothetical protein J3F84DRAFT_305993 [Trichoderma pleuroticola]
MRSAVHYNTYLLHAPALHMHIRRILCFVSNTARPSGFTTGWLGHAVSSLPKGVALSPVLVKMGKTHQRERDPVDVLKRQAEIDADRKYSYEYSVLVLERLDHRHKLDLLFFRAAANCLERWREIAHCHAPPPQDARLSQGLMMLGRGISEKYRYGSTTHTPIPGNSCWGSNPVWKGSNMASLAVAAGAHRELLRRAKRIDMCSCIIDRIGKWNFSPMTTSPALISGRRGGEQTGRAQGACIFHLVK